MTRRVGDVVVIERGPPSTCDLCGREAETRPYGPGGADVCFDCGMQDEEEAKRRFEALLDGQGPQE